jgi:hypothetical protein
MQPRLAQEIRLILIQYLGTIIYDYFGVYLDENGSVLRRMISKIAQNLFVEIGVIPIEDRTPRAVGDREVPCSGPEEQLSGGDGGLCTVIP